MTKYTGARLTGEFKGRKVHVACDRCKTARRFDGDRIIERVGAEFALPELLSAIAAGIGCHLNEAPTPNGIRCGLRYDGPSARPKP